MYRSQYLTNKSKNHSYSEIQPAMLRVWKIRISKKEVTKLNHLHTPCAHRGPRFAADSRSISWLAHRSRPRSLCTFCLSPST